MKGPRMVPLGKSSGPWGTVWAQAQMWEVGKPNMERISKGKEETFARN